MFEAGLLAKSDLKLQSSQREPWISGLFASTYQVLELQMYITTAILYGAVIKFRVSRMSDKHFTNWGRFLASIGFLLQSEQIPSMFESVKDVKDYRLLYEAITYPYKCFVFLKIMGLVDSPKIYMLNSIDWYLRMWLNLEIGSLKS